MAVQFNPAASQVQSSITNPFTQRGEDQVRSSGQRDEDKNTTATRPQNASAAKSQEFETRRDERNEVAQREEASETRRTQQRGSVVDITV